MSNSGSNSSLFKKSISTAEWELVSGLKSGQINTFNKLYKLYAPNLFGVLVHFVKQQETAEDLLQECFIKISANIESYDPDKSRLFTWMLNITRNSAIDYIRKRSSVNQKSTFHIDSISDEIANRFTSSLNTDTMGINKIVA